MALDLQKARERRDATRESFSRMVERAGLHSILVEGGKARSHEFHMRISEEDMCDARELSTSLDMSVACLIRMLLRAAKDGN